MRRLCISLPSLPAWPRCSRRNLIPSRATWPDAPRVATSSVLELRLILDVLEHVPHLIPRRPLQPTCDHHLPPPERPYPLLEPLVPGRAPQDRLGIGPLQPDLQERLFELHPGQ